MRVGIPWLGSTCGECHYCRQGAEDLCERREFTGYTRDGGYATDIVADARFVFEPADGDDVRTAPLLCAGLIGWRSLRITGEGRSIGLYGFGAAAHIIAQVARWQRRKVFAFTRCGDVSAQKFATELGVSWAGSSDGMAPEPLDCAIIFAPVRALVPTALRSVRKGGRLVCAGFHMSDIPSFPYRLLWEERQIASVANLTRRDAVEFFAIAPKVGIRISTDTHPLAMAKRSAVRPSDWPLQRRGRSCAIESGRSCAIEKRLVCRGSSPAGRWWTDGAFRAVDGPTQVWLKREEPFDRERVGPRSLAAHAPRWPVDAD